MAVFKIPYLNPVHFVKMTPDEVPAYVSRHIDAWSFEETIESWEQHVVWPPLWQKSDSIPLQFISTYGPITVKQCKCDGTVLATTSVSQVRQNVYDPTEFIYEAALPQSIFDEGDYYLQLELGSGTPVVFIYSFKLSERIENSLCLEYFHREFKDGMFFETGFRPRMRIPGLLKMKQPTSSHTEYEDEDYNLETLKGVGYEIYQLQVGIGTVNPVGVPPWLIKKLNRILTLSNISFDGREYVKNGEAAFEEATEQDYPLSVWTIELREKVRRDSIIYEDDVIVEGQFAVVLVSDSKGFGTQAPGSDYFIQDVQ